MELAKKMTLAYLIKDGKWLMLLRNKKENDINEGKWIGVGGKVEEGESVEQAAIREIEEETGYIVDDIEYCGEVLFLYDIAPAERIYVYQSRNFHGEEIECTEGSLSWIKEEDIMDLSLWEGDRIFLKKMMEGNIPFHIMLHYDENAKLVEVKDDDDE